ncbi:hypothetical protein SAZ10_29420 [Mesorhizobium sp. BAC0120]|uniref:hypothetical protein n=1 Tax=Mesorhizobium sp. BAC0120 TaxID=3090670 RepID=UPI00298C3BDC|nr:hypothetical protein [Mesorhizobium sp. BAC0120]MDW6025887.1 hypothetical protein [Mesorhizobium sp. BAC0120]
MTLSSSLLHIEMTFDCPFCAHPLVKTGTWFQTTSGFRCVRCQKQVRITYSDKVALFDKHANST